MLETVRSLLSATPTVVHECRECGHTVDETADSCPACGSASIARYRVE